MKCISFTTMAKINWTKFFNLIQVDETLKKKRAFRKFTYRGVDLDQLLDMPKWVKWTHSHTLHRPKYGNFRLNPILMTLFLAHRFPATNWSNWCIAAHADVSRVDWNASHWLSSRNFARRRRRLHHSKNQPSWRPICVTWLSYQKWLAPSLVSTTAKHSIK